MRLPMPSEFHQQLARLTENRHVTHNSDLNLGPEDNIPPLNRPILYRSIWLYIYTHTILFYLPSYLGPCKNLVNMTFSLLRAHDYLIQNIGVLEFCNGLVLDFLGSQYNSQWLLWSIMIDEIWYTFLNERIV